MHKIKSALITFKILNFILLYSFAIFLITKDYGIFNLIYVILVVSLIMIIIITPDLEIPYFSILSVKTIIFMQIIFFISTMVFWSPMYPPKWEDFIKISYDFVNSLKCWSVIKTFLIYSLIILAFKVTNRIIKRNIFLHEIISLHYFVILYNYYQLEYHLSHAHHNWSVVIFGWLTYVMPLSLIHMIYCMIISKITNLKIYGFKKIEE